MTDNHSTSAADSRPSSKSSGEIVFDTEWFNVERLNPEGDGPPNGKPYYRINAPDGVIVVALTEDREIVLVRQFRPALGRHTLELPAGAVDPNETREEAAARELYEETGYICKSMTFLGTGHLLCNRLNASQFAFLGSEAALHAAFTPREDIQPVLVAADEFKRLILTGEFDQWAAMAAILLADWKVGTSLILPGAG